MIHIKYCKKCKKAFDIATNNVWCYNCRNKIEVENIFELRSRTCEQQT